MSTLVNDLRKAIESSSKDWTDPANQMFSGDTPSAKWHPIIKELNDLGFEFRAEDHYGGEGQGEEYWSVVKVTRGDEVAFIKFTGWYASFNGAEMSHGAEAFTEVKKVPVESYEWEEQ
jgi:hypothetical protein